MYEYSVTPTVSSSTAYTAGDAVGGKMTIETGQYEYAMLQNVTIEDSDKQNAEIDIFFFDTDFTATTDNQAFALTTTDLNNCVGTVTVSNYSESSARSVGDVNNLAKVLKLASSSGNKSILYAQAVTRGTPTYVGTSRLKFKFGFIPYKG